MNQRLERINSLIREEISGMLRKDIHDPLIGFVTIIDVDVSADLRHAKVFFSVLGDTEQVRNSIKGLLRARKFINSRLAERLELRYIPKIRFVLDETAAKAQRMQQLLTHEHEELAETLARHAAEPDPEALNGKSAPEAEPDELDDADEDDLEVGFDDEADEEWDEDADLDDEDENEAPVK